MRLKEAIEIVREEYREHHSFSTDVIGQAEQLLIKAGEWVRDNRVDMPGHVPKLLPGETED